MEFASNERRPRPTHGGLVAEYLRAHARSFRSARSTAEASISGRVLADASPERLRAIGVPDAVIREVRSALESRASARPAPTPAPAPRPAPALPPAPVAPDPRLAGHLADLEQRLAACALARALVWSDRI